MTAKIHASNRIPQRIVDLVLRQAKGCYQEGLLSGSQNWSGSDLKGKARDWSGRYAWSRRALELRVDEALSKVGWHATWTQKVCGTPQRLRNVFVLEGPKGGRYYWGSCQ